MNPLIRTEAQLAADSCTPESAAPLLRMLNAILRALDRACGGDSAPVGCTGYEAAQALLQADDGHRTVNVAFDDGGRDCITIKIGPYTAHDPK